MKIDESKRNVSEGVEAELTQSDDSSMIDDDIGLDDPQPTDEYSTDSNITDCSSSRDKENDEDSFNML
jgi:hypothetical protein